MRQSLAAEVHLVNCTNCGPTLTEPSTEREDCWPVGTWLNLDKTMLAGQISQGGIHAEKVQRGGVYLENFHPSLVLKEDGNIPSRYQQRGRNYGWLLSHTIGRAHQKRHKRNSLFLEMC